MTNFTHAKYGPDTVRIDDPTYVVPLLTEDVTVGTGLAFPAADTVAIEAGGVEKARFTSTLNSLAGVTKVLANSASAALTVTQTGAGNAFVVEDSASTDSTPFVVNAAGIVNVAHPTAITGALAAVMHLQVAKTDSEAIGAYLFNASSSGPALEFGQSNNSTVGSHTVVASGDNLGVIRFSGSDGTNFIRGAQIVCAVDGTPGTNDMPGLLVFSTTADGASSPTERMRINSAGNVGIGATSLTGHTLRLSKNISGSTTSYGIYSDGIVQSDVTGAVSYFMTSPGTVDAVTGPTTLFHFRANQGTVSGGTRTAVTNQYGFIADSALTGATNNYGFYSNIAAAANRWNFYAAGTADNYFAGSLGVGTAGLSSGYKVDILPPAGGNALRIRGGSGATSIVQFTDNAESAAWADITTTATSWLLNHSAILRLGTASTEKLRIDSGGVITARIGTAIPAGGTAGFGYCATSTANFGVFFGSGAPTLSAAQGSIYLRSDGSSTSTRMYVNTNGTTGWTAVTTAT